MGTPLVSGKKRYTNTVIIQIQLVKNRKIPYLKEHNKARNPCAIENVKRRFTKTVMACPAERVSSGKISLGTVHPRGPQDHPNAARNKQIAATNNAEKPLDSPLSPSNFRPKIIPTANCEKMTTILLIFMKLSVSNPTIMKKKHYIISASENSNVKKGFVNRVACPVAKS